MLKKILTLLLSIFTLLSSKTSYAQNDSTAYDEFDMQPEQIDTILRKNTIFAELGGNGFIYSINYDRLINVSKKVKLAARIGIHYTHYFPLKYYRTLCVPVEFSGLYSFYKRKHFIEIGSGLSYLNNYYSVKDHTEDIIILAFRLGYRYQQPEGGLFVKIGFVPIYDWLVFNKDASVPHHSWLLSGGLGIGYTF